MAYATKEDIEVRYGRPLTPAQAAQATAWIEDLEADILERVPNLADLVAAGRPSPGTMKRIECAAIIRVLQNPEGLKSFTEAIDDYSVTKVRDNTLAAGLLELTDDEWAKILPGLEGDSFSIRMIPS